MKIHYEIALKSKNPLFSLTFFFIACNVIFTMKKLRNYEKIVRKSKPTCGSYSSKKRKKKEKKGKIRNQEYIETIIIFDLDYETDNL